MRLSTAVDSPFLAPGEFAQRCSDLSLRAEAVLRRAVAARAAPNHQKTMRLLSTREVAAWIGTEPTTILKAVDDMGGDIGDTGPRNGKLFTSEELHRIRDYFITHRRGGVGRYSNRKADGTDGIVVAISNFKGGVGKTTHGMHLAEYLALRGFRVLAVDLDPQATLTSLFGNSPDQDFVDDFDVGRFQTIYGVMSTAVDSVLPLARQSHIHGLDYIPANSDLQRSEFELPVLHMKQESAPVFSLLHDALREAKREYDVIVMDCPPSLNYATINACFSSDLLFVPLSAHMYDFASTGRYLAMLADTVNVLETVADRSVDIGMIKVFLTRFDPNDNNQQIIAQLLQHEYADTLLEVAMVRTTILDYAGAWMDTIYGATDYTNKKSYDRARESMDELNAEFERIIIGLRDHRLNGRAAA